MTPLRRIFRRAFLGSGQRDLAMPGVETPAPESLSGSLDLGDLAAREEMEVVGIVRPLLAWCMERPGCRAAWFLAPADSGWSARDRFDDVDPIPVDLERVLTRVAPRRLEQGNAWLSPADKEPGLEELPSQCGRRGIQRLLLLALPAWAPEPGWLLLGFAEEPLDPMVATVSGAMRELAYMSWIHRLRADVSSERGLVLAEHNRLMVQGFDMVRIRQQTDREVELARRRVEEAERAKNEFLSSVSHELRTPLNAIQGYTRMVLRESNLTDRQRLSLERVMTSSQNQLRLINNILDYSRLEAGRMRLALEELDLAQVLRDVVQQVEPLAQEQGLQLKLELPDNADQLKSFTDRAKLEQVLINLLGNAIKFTPKGSITLRTRYRAGIVCLDIVDSGIGIPREEQEQIFERFRRSRQSESARSASGTGLGLAISRRLAELLGGSITLVSESGVGSTFTLNLPMFLDLETATLALAGSEAEEE